MISHSMHLWMTKVFCSSWTTTKEITIFLTALSHFTACLRATLDPHFWGFLTISNLAGENSFSVYAMCLVSLLLSGISSCGTSIQNKYSCFLYIVHFDEIKFILYYPALKGSALPRLHLSKWKVMLLSFVIPNAERTGRQSSTSFDSSNSSRYMS